ncbi:hypothetical protein HAX54_029823, partial [Datura stramonium]|nr:hypothetical protein [Datura stramonium]
VPVLNHLGKDNTTVPKAVIDEQDSPADLDPLPDTPSSQIENVESNEEGAL